MIWVTRIRAIIKLERSLHYLASHWHPNKIQGFSNLDKGKMDVKNTEVNTTLSGRNRAKSYPWLHTLKSAQNLLKYEDIHFFISNQDGKTAYELLQQDDKKRKLFFESNMKEPVKK